MNIIKKKIFIDPTFIKNTTLKKNEIPIISRKSFILPNFVGKVFQIHSGKTFIKLVILKNMIGHKFGEFIFTRAKFIFKKKKKTVKQ